ncbi:MAG: hypothetical protein OEO77_10655 [Acidimicrobiia bacterium]|nr:hypothetical protein [Acidimicrobiia bacterium]
MRLFARVLLFGAAIFLAACSGEAGPAGPAGSAGPAGPAGPAGSDATFEVADLTCTGCHNDTTLLASKQAQFYRHSVHGTGDAYERGASTSCAGCHGSEAAEARIEAGLPPHDASVAGVVNVSPYTCRTCHDIHTTYTEADFSLSGDEQPVTLEYTGGTFDKGAANLCANCHQIRNELPVLTGAAGAEFEVTSTRFGTHHGVEASMLLGEGGLLASGSESVHYQVVEEACVSCHMGEEYNHTFEPDLANCQGCHADLDTFDRNGVQTEITALMEEVKALLVEAGIMDLETGDGRSFTGVYPEAVAGAMWNYVYVMEDQSMGVHNPAYTKALLEAAKTALGG